jgi:hypothetical protein
VGPLFLPLVNEQSASFLGVWTLAVPSRVQGDGGGGRFSIEGGERAFFESPG